MKFYELLAVTDSKQQIVITNIKEEVNQMDSCLYFWECNVFPDKLIRSVKIKENKMIVMLDIL